MTKQHPFPDYTPADLQRLFLGETLHYIDENGVEHAATVLGVHPKEQLLTLSVLQQFLPTPIYEGLRDTYGVTRVIVVSLNLGFGLNQAHHRQERHGDPAQLRPADSRVPETTPRTTPNAGPSEPHGPTWQEKLKQFFRDWM